MKKNTITFLIILFFFNGYSQVDTANNKKLKEKAESAELNGDINNALYFYTLFNEQKHKYKTDLKIATLNYKARNYLQAKSYYLKLVNATKYQPISDYYTGLCYKNLGLYDSCLYFFNKCNIKKLSDKQKARLKNEKEGAYIALRYPKDTSVIKIKRLNSLAHINKMESAPFFINDSLIIYSSDLVNDRNLYSYTDTSNIPLRKLFYIEKKDSVWKNKAIDIGLNNGFQNIDNGYLSIDKQRYYFTSTQKNWHNKNISNLYVSAYKNKQFINPQKLGSDINNNFYSSTQPAIGTTYNPDLEVVYFSSDRPGGKGGMDIWYTILNKKRGTFTKPINAGTKINTKFDEITPFYDFSTKTLYYSSNGLIGFGGYDVYKTIGELRSWTPPVNVGNYLNSNNDEIYFRLNNSRSGGILASNQPFDKAVTDNCCFDLFYFTYNNPDQLFLKGSLTTKVDPLIETIMARGVELRDSSLTKKNKLKNAIVLLYLKTDLGKDSLLITSDTTDANGGYKFNVGKEQNYAIVIHDKGNIKGYAEVSTKGIKNNKTEIIVAIDPIKQLPKSALIIKNIYYEVGKSALTQAAKSRLDSTLIYLMKNMRNIIVEVSSHTDNLGSNEFNLRLSEERAQKVADYIVSQGINRKRLREKGYGETQPIANNQNEDGSDNAEGRKLNRRTEFKIIGTKQNNNSF